MKPYDFVNILEDNCGNVNLDRNIQSGIHHKILIDYPVEKFSPIGKTLKAISDNGDLFYELGSNSTFIVNQRNGSIMELNMSFEQVIDNLPTIMIDEFN